MCSRNFRIYGINWAIISVVIPAYEVSEQNLKFFLKQEELRSTAKAIYLHHV